MEMIKNMRIGLFLGEDHDFDSLAGLISTLGNELVGYSAISPIAEFSNLLSYEPYPIELLAGCDTAIVYPGQGVWAEVPRAAVRRGVNLYLADFPSYSKHTIVELQNLLQEINIAFEFGFSGFNIDEFLPNQISQNDLVYFDFKRELKKESDFSLIKRMLVYDISTMVRLNVASIKKVRVFSLPKESLEYNLLNIRIELNNGGIYCYTISRIGDEENFDAKLYGSLAVDQISINSKESILDLSVKNLSTSPLEFIDRLKRGVKPQFTIDKALEVHRLLDEVQEKLTILSR
jgi:hypothetical protein